MAFLELKVQDDGVTRQRLQGRYGFCFRLRMSYDFDMVKRRDSFGQTLTNHRGVLDEENAQRMRRASP